MSERHALECVEYDFTYRPGRPVRGLMTVLGPDPLPPTFLLRDYCPEARPGLRVRVIDDSPVYQFPPTSFTSTRRPDGPPVVVARRVDFVGIPEGGANP